MNYKNKLLRKKSLEYFQYSVQLSLMPDSIVVEVEITIISIYIPRCIYHSSLAEQIMRNKLNAPTWSRSGGDHPGQGGEREEGGLSQVFMLCRIMSYHSKSMSSQHWSQL